jgi:hypothetical protein
MTAARPSSSRDVLGAATLALVLLGTALALFPATAALGLLLCLAMIGPAIVAFLRAREGSAADRRRSFAALLLAPAFVLVAASLLATRLANLPDRQAPAVPAVSAAPVSVVALVPVAVSDVTVASAPVAVVSVPAEFACAGRVGAGRGRAVGAGTELVV